MQIAHGTYSRTAQNGNGSDTVCSITATNNPNFNTKLIMIANCTAVSGSKDDQSGNNSQAVTSCRVSGSGITTTGPGQSTNGNFQNKSKSGTFSSGNLTKGATHTVLGTTTGSYEWSGSGDALLLEVKI